ncbi:helix-turn-helix domain-containing protein [uncultured Sphingomonas sp.]|uniref:helix-turn-helix transcriptional regulator n=1 Tax=uncultured Sphingomonas sp. TaxID=158754 RepID=UPI003454A7ED
MDGLLTIDEAAEHLDMSRRTLHRLRKKDGFPATFATSPRKVYFRKCELDDWLKSR